MLLWGSPRFDFDGVCGAARGDGTRIKSGWAWRELEIRVWGRVGGVKTGRECAWAYCMVMQAAAGI